MNGKVMWETILQRKGVAVVGHAALMGPERCRSAAALIFLDRV